MARTVKPEIYEAKRNEILDATQRLVLTKGYERMTLQDIVAELQISSGAFYHYFDSKPAVLEAFVERNLEHVERLLRTIVDDAELPPIAKLQRFFDTLDQLRLAHKDEVIQLARIWYSDANAIVRQKINDAVQKQRAPLLTRIVKQGVREGVFCTPHPEQAGDVILALLHGMGDLHAQLLITNDQPDDDTLLVEQIVTLHAAFMEAVERVIGASPRSLYRVEAKAVRAWTDSLHKNAPD